MDNQSSILIKRDINKDDNIAISTYQNIKKGMKYTTYKNNKATAWSSSFEGALGNHNMYSEPQILKTSDENAVAEQYYSEVSLKKRSNAFLHDFPSGFEPKLNPFKYR